MATVLTVRRHAADASRVTPSVPPPSLPTPVGKPPETPSSRSAGPRVLASAALAVVVAGITFSVFAVFGGSPSRLVDPVAQAASISTRTPGYRVHLAMRLSTSASVTPITATGDGTFDLRDRSGSMAVAMNLGDNAQALQTLGTNTFRMEEILNGTTVYMKLPAFAASPLPISGKQWIAVDLAHLTGIPGASLLKGTPMSSDPRQMLQYLRAASNSIVAEGHQRVNGLETTHYRADLSLDRIAGAVPSADQAAAQQALTTLEQAVQIHDIPVDVWVDAKHLVRRIEMTMTGALPSGQALNEVVTIDISEYGPQPPPVLPPSGEVANLSELLGSSG